MKKVICFLMVFAVSAFCFAKEVFPGFWGIELGWSPAWVASEMFSRGWECTENSEDGEILDYFVFEKDGGTYATIAAEEAGFIFRNRECFAEALLLSSPAESQIEKLRTAIETRYALSETDPGVLGADWAYTDEENSTILLLLPQEDDETLLVFMDWRHLADFVDEYQAAELQQIYDDM